MRLAVATICPHYFHNQQWWSYQPFVLEMDMWCELFDELLFIAPLESGIPPPFWAPYRNSDSISVIPYRKDRGHGLEQDSTSMREIPQMLFAIVKAARQADAFHVRSPGSIGLLSTLIVPLLRKRICAKYAGQWTGYPGETFSVWLQRAILRSPWWRGPVTVYGHWPNQPRNIIPFFTSMLTIAQMERANGALSRRNSGNPLRVLYVGRLSTAKHIDTLVSAIADLRTQNIYVEGIILGEGPERPSLEIQVSALNLDDRITFTGALSFERVLDFYEQADVLVLVSETEGWPKAIAEGMAFGLICIGSNRGLIPQMLGEGRGIVIPAGDVEALTLALQQIASSPGNYHSMRTRAAVWAQGYSAENLRDSLRVVLTTHWKTPLNNGRQMQDTRTCPIRL